MLRKLPYKYSFRRNATSQPDVGYQPAASTVRRRGQRPGEPSKSGRKPISSAIDVEPVHSPAGAFDWHDYLQAIEWWRSATNAGRDFLHLARSILEQVDSLVTRAHRTGRGEAGRLTIGFYTSLTAGNLRATLVDYARRFPAGSNRNGGRDHSGRVGGIERNQHSCCPFTPRLEPRRRVSEMAMPEKTTIKSMGYGLAERVGFEPTVRFPAHTLSKRAP
jgi:hypothetical protein